jgi:branched-chain amino acid aminotransferase
MQPVSASQAAVLRLVLGAAEAGATVVVQIQVAVDESARPGGSRGSKAAASAGVLAPGSLPGARGVGPGARPSGNRIAAYSDPTEGHTMSMSDRDGKIWMDGELVEWRDARIHVLSHTLHYGCGAFEGVRAYNTVGGTAIFRLREHTERLFNSAKILRMKIPFSLVQVMDAQREVVRANKLESCYLRPLTWIGSEKLGVSPKGNKIHLMVAAWPWGAYLGEEGMKRGIRVKISSYTRHHVNITMTQAKAVSNYTNSILANMEATDDGYDEAMLLDASGFVSEGAGENLFVIKNGVVYTPDLSAGALNGITRNTVFAICKDLGLALVEKRITRDEVYICDEAFFTGTAAEVTPIRELDRIELGSGARGPITEKIQSAFFDIVNGRNPKYAEWLTKV